MFRPTKKIALAAAAVTALAALALPYVTFAGGVSLAQMQKLGPVNLQQLIANIIRAFLGLVGSIALLMFVIAGFTWMTAAGNEQKIKDAKNNLLWSSLGLAVMFLSFAAVKFILNALG